MSKTHLFHSSNLKVHGQPTKMVFKICFNLKKKITTFIFFLEETNSTCYCKSCIPIFEQIRERFEIHNGSEGDTIQKKITPWKEMLETDDFFENRVAAHPNLILVGSLVDRPPNLVTYLVYFLTEIHKLKSNYLVRVACVGQVKF